MPYLMGIQPSWRREFQLGVTKTVGAASLIRNGENGLIVPPCDEQSLKECLELLIDDPEQRTSIGEEVFKNVRRAFSWNNYVRRAITTYQKLIDQPIQ